MSSNRTRASEACPYENCGSKRFHIGDDGYTYCDRGHQQSHRGTVIAEDTGELVIHGQKSRKKDSDTESATSRASSYSGSRAFEHYLLCIQLVLRKQLRWLIDVQKLPEELETIVKDLWTLRLQKLRHRPAYDSETDTEAPSSQVFSSQTETDTGTESQSSRRKHQKASNANRETLNLVETVVLCYLGALLLRIPITVADLLKWISEGDLLYYRAHREVPLGMRERLPGEYERQLEPQDLLRSESVHQHVLGIISILSSEVGMAVPAINTPLVLYRWTKDLALPLEIFVAVQRLARVVGVDFAYGGRHANLTLRYPEPRLMALLIIATKLLFPLDGLKRYPRLARDLSALSFDWHEWVKIREEDDKSHTSEMPLTFEQAFDFAESDCIVANDETLDAYLDWYGNNIASEEVREQGPAGSNAEFRRALLAMFPLDPASAQRPAEVKHSSAHSSKDRAQRVHAMLSPNDIIGESLQGQEAVRRPGSFYRRFRSAEELSGAVKVLYQRAARLAGLPVEDMVQAVFLTERKLQKHEEHLRRADRAD